MAPTKSAARPSDESKKTPQSDKMTGAYPTGITKTKSPSTKDKIKKLKERMKEIMRSEQSSDEDSEEDSEENIEEISEGEIEELMDEETDDEMADDETNDDETEDDETDDDETDDEMVEDEMLEIEEETDDESEAGDEKEDEFHDLHPCLFGEDEVKAIVRHMIEDRTLKITCRYSAYYHLHRAAEDLLLTVFAETRLCALHAGRDELKLEDFALAKRLTAWWGRFAK